MPKSADIPALSLAACRAAIVQCEFVYSTGLVLFQVADLTALLVRAGRDLRVDRVTYEKFALYNIAQVLHQGLSDVISIDF